MDFSPHLIQGPKQVEPSFNDEQHFSQTDAQAVEGQEAKAPIAQGGRWVKRMKTILRSLPTKNAGPKTPLRTERRIRQLAKLKALKIKFTLSRPEIAKLSRQMGFPVRLPMPKRHQAIHILRKGQQPPGKIEQKPEVKEKREQELLTRCRIITQRLTRPEVKERIKSSFTHVEGKVQEKPAEKTPAFSAPKRETKPGKAEEKDPKEIKEEKEAKLERREPIKEKEARKEEKETEDAKAKREEDSSSFRAPAVEPQVKQLDKLHPDFFLGLGSVQTAAERLAKQTAFRKARLVLIVQGPSEQTLLNFLFKLYGNMQRQIFIWPLASGELFSDAWFFLKQLKVSYVTLLNLELGRVQGGWTRLRLVLRRLLAFQHANKPRPPFKEEQIAALPGAYSSTEGMERWLRLLEAHNIFFCSPLDFHYMMLRSFPQVYRKMSESSEKPQPEEWKRQISKWVEGPEGYTEKDRALLGWYSLLFYSYSPESLHKQALQHINTMDLLHDLPEVILRLIQRVRQLIRK